MLERRLRDLADVLDAEPNLTPGDQFYMLAFHRLATCRSMGPGPIPWRDIVDYADRSRLDRVETAVFVDVISALDRAWLEHMDKKGDG